MRVRIDRNICQELIKRGFVLEHREPNVSTYSAHNDIDLEWLTDDGLDYLDSLGNATIGRKVLQFMRAKANPEGETVDKLDMLPILFKGYMEKKTERRWLFKEETEGHLLAYVVTGCDYHPPKRYDGYVQPAYVSLNMTAYRHDTTSTENTDWGREALGKTVDQLLYGRGFMVENPELLADYEAGIERFDQLRGKVGHQMIATGIGIAQSSKSNDYYSRRSTSHMVVDGIASKVLIDNDSPELGSGSNRSNIGMNFWNEKKLTEDADNYKVFPVPTHPYVYVFSLVHHGYFDVHMDTLQDYMWKDDIADKLVLPEADRRLIDLLVRSTDKKMEDIIDGKSQGILVLASGPPGTGKTLTAEVTSEVMHRPLYSVQCSQLGLSGNSIEETLKKLLGRADRWGALMLLDEADVYVRERGADIQQNAVVGVFLRTLEYYNGFLYLTTNRESSIDDAILSRVTAHVRYEAPEASALGRIVDIQAKALNIKVTADARKHIMENHLGMSGRDVRAMLKLAMLVLDAEEKDTVDVNMVDFVLTYQEPPKARPMKVRP